MAPPSIQVVRSSSVDEVLAMLRRAQPTVDGETPRRRFSQEHAAEMLRLGHRRADWAWEARDEAGERLGLLVAFGIPDQARPFVIDLHDCPTDPTAAHALYRRAHDDIAAIDPAFPVEMIVQADATDDPDSLPGMQRIIDAAASVGSRVAVRRTTMRLDAADVSSRAGGASGAAASPPRRLEMETVAPDDARLLPLMMEIIRHSVDLTHERDREQRGLEAAASASLELELGLVGDKQVVIASWSGKPVGLGIARWMDDAGLVAFVGVGASAAGQGFGHELLDHLVTVLLERGCTTVVGDSDNPNERMMRLFRSHGFRPKASRIDFIAD